MKRISIVSYDLQHTIANGLIAMGFSCGYCYKARLDERLTYTLAN